MPFKVDQFVFDTEDEANDFVSQQKIQSEGQNQPNDFLNFIKTPTISAGGVGKELHVQETSPVSGIDRLRLGFATTQGKMDFLTKQGYTTFVDSDNSLVVAKDDKFYKFDPKHFEVSDLADIVGQISPAVGMTAGSIAGGGLGSLAGPKGAALGQTIGGGLGGMAGELNRQAMGKGLGIEQEFSPEEAGREGVAGGIAGAIGPAMRSGGSFLRGLTGEISGMGRGPAQRIFERPFSNQVARFRGLSKEEAGTQIAKLGEQARQSLQIFKDNTFKNAITDLKAIENRLGNPVIDTVTLRNNLAKNIFDAGFRPQLTAMRKVVGKTGKISKAFSKKYPEFDSLYRELLAKVGPDNFSRGINQLGKKDVLELFPRLTESEGRELLSIVDNVRGLSNKASITDLVHIRQVIDESELFKSKSVSIGLGKPDAYVGILKKFRTDINSVLHQFPDVASRDSFLHQRLGIINELSRGMSEKNVESTVSNLTGRNKNYQKVLFEALDNEDGGINVLNDIMDLASGQKATPWLRGQLAALGAAGVAITGGSMLKGLGTLTAFSPRISSYIIQTAGIANLGTKKLIQKMALDPKFVAVFVARPAFQRATVEAIKKYDSELEPEKNQQLAE